MGDMERRYTDQEFALILRKAAELQDRSGVAAPAEGGLSLTEIAAIAREVGLDPDRVAQAAAELDSVRPARLSRLLGGSAHHRFETSVPGTLPPDAYPRVIDAVRAASRLHGEARETLGSVEWRASDGLTQLFVTITPSPDATRIVVTADRSSAQGVTWLLPSLLSFVAVGITGAIVEPSTVAGGLGLAAGVLGAGLLGARTLWAGLRRRFESRVEGILERTAREVGAASENGAD